jgi:hypothetical protein
MRRIFLCTIVLALAGPGGAAGRPARLQFRLALRPAPGRIVAGAIERSRDRADVLLDLDGDGSEREKPILRSALDAYRKRVDDAERDPTPRK